MGRRLPFQRVRIERDDVAGVCFAAGATVAAAIGGGLAYGRHAATLTAVVLGPIGLITVGLTVMLARRRRLMGGIRRQLIAVAVLVLAQLLAAVALLCVLMFVSSHDAFFAVTVAAFAGSLGLWATRALARPILGDIDRMRGAVARISAGDRDVQLAASGSDELAQMAGDIERMARQMAADECARAAAEAAHRDLLAMVSHDLRTPITSLRLLADALDDNLVDEATRREYVARISTHVRALGGLIDDLFEISRLRAGDVTWSMEQVRLPDLVQETIDAMRPQVEAKALSVRADVDERAQLAQADPQKLQRVLFNLIQNAIHNTPADGSITIKTRPSGDQCEVEVADSGVGIPVTERELVFEPFYQGAANAARSGGSAGLGLAIARAIVEAHGGRIWIADAAAGTRVRFSLPAANLLNSSQTPAAAGV